MKNKVPTKQLFVLIFVGISFSLFLMAILEDGKLDKDIFRKEEVSLRGVYIANIPLWVEVADTLEKRRAGLSGRKKLEENRGMLFAFDTPDIHGIWMKDMNFSIDILWVDKDYRIIDIKQQARPESFPNIFYPRADAVYIIEVRSGFTRLHNINIGDKGVQIAHIAG